jgi:diaminopimelate epimerase
MKIQFYKMSGAGNDFVVIDNRNAKIKQKVALARTLCERRYGVGADGLILIEKDSAADFKMCYYNADGSYGGMCGNGGRCAAFFAFTFDIAKRTHHFTANKRHYHAEILKGGRVSLSMIDPENIQLHKKLTADGMDIPYHFIYTGSPHVVINIHDIADETLTLEKADFVERIGRAVRLHEAFAPGGTNVNFIQREGANGIKIRTYERGVEAETFACGTGSVGSALIASLLWGLKSPVRVLPKSKELLKVSFTPGEQITDVRLEGPAVITFRGEIEVK